MPRAFCRRISRAARLGALLTPFVMAATYALAHTSERGHVMLLPTCYYLAGGALAVAASFFVLALARPEPLERLAGWRLTLLNAPVRGRTLASFVSFLFFAVLVVAGFRGSRDPLSNPLPLTVWTLFWVGLTLVQGLLGNFWAWLNPWYGPYRLAAGRRGTGTALRLPETVGYWPAIAIFFAFAWFELVYPAPDDPWRLALVVSLYWLANFCAMLTFGYEEWARRGEVFSVFFGMISRLSIFEADEGGLKSLALCPPGAKLATTPALPLSGTLFLLLALASVSFDGLMRSFFWLGLNGINPLEFPGRSAVVGPNSIGLAMTFAVLSSAFFAAVFLGNRLAGGRLPLRQAAGALVWSIIPISLAYHFSHYLTAFLVNGQYALAALSDPFSIGWNLFGTARDHVNAGIVAGHESARAIWNAQAAAIIGGHVLAIVAAHVIACRLHGSRSEAVLSQIPLACLMVAYTVFGLWLLSTPTAG